MLQRFSENRLPHHLCPMIILLAVVAALPVPAQTGTTSVRAYFENPIFGYPLSENWPASTFFGGHAGPYQAPNSTDPPEIPSYVHYRPLPELPVTRYLMRSSFGQPFARSMPYPDFIQGTLDAVRGMLYYADAPAGQEDDAAFAYQHHMYEVVDEEFEFGPIGTYWDPTHQERARQALALVRGALNYLPTQPDFRQTLLDICYDFAVAEMAAAQEELISAVKISLGIGVTQGTLVIDEKVTKYEFALDRFENAQSLYRQILNEPVGPYSSAVPLGFQVFQEEVPGRSPYSVLLKDPSGNWVPPSDAPPGSESQEIFTGYKDLVLLFNIQREYARTAAELGRLYVMRGEPGDEDAAREMVAKALQNTFAEGNILLGVFPDCQDADPDDSSGLAGAISGWRQAMSDLTLTRDYVVYGVVNPLGYAHDFLVLFGQPTANVAWPSTYDDLYPYVKGSDGFLDVALQKQTDAISSYQSLRFNQDSLRTELGDKTAYIEARLEQIVGANPVEPQGYGPGSEIERQVMSLESARLELEQNVERLENLDALIQIEIEDCIAKMAVNARIEELYLEAEGEVRRLNEFNVAATKCLTGAVGILGVASGVAGIIASGGTGTPVGIALIAGGLGVLASMELSDQQNETAASKEELQWMTEAKVVSAQGELIQLESAKNIAKINLDRYILQLESHQLQLAIQQEMSGLQGLLQEKASLESRLLEVREDLAGRYFADPSHREVSNRELLEAEAAFKNAQSWMFILVRALEYKWNAPFQQDGYTKETLFRLQNAAELNDMLTAMRAFDGLGALSFVVDDDFIKLSFRRDILGYRQAMGRYYPIQDPDTGATQMVDGITAFQHYIRHAPRATPEELDSIGLTVNEAIVLDFSTVFIPPDNYDHFAMNRWNQKIGRMKFKLVGATRPPDLEPYFGGYLAYGGTAYIRASSMAGEEVPTAYGTKYWFYNMTEQRWDSQPAFAASVRLWTGTDPDVPGDGATQAFQERSVAASGWKLYIPTLSVDNNPLVYLDNIRDIQIHFQSTNLGRTQKSE